MTENQDFESSTDNIPNEGNEEDCYWQNESDNLSENIEEEWLDEIGKEDLNCKPKTRDFWTDDEITSLINLMKDQKVLKMFDDPRLTNIDIYKNIKGFFDEMGFKRTAVQIYQKYLNLRKDFRTAQRILNTSGQGTSSKKAFKYYNDLAELFKLRPYSTQPGIDSINPINIEKEKDKTESISIKKKIVKQGPLKEIMNEMVNKITESDSNFMQKMIEEQRKMNSENISSLREILKDNTSTLITGMKEILSPSSMPDSNTVSQSHISNIGLANNSYFVPMNSMTAVPIPITPTIVSKPVNFSTIPMNSKPISLPNIATNVSKSLTPIITVPTSINPSANSSQSVISTFVPEPKISNVMPKLKISNTATPRTKRKKKN